MCDWHAQTVARLPTKYWGYAAYSTQSKWGRPLCTEFWRRKKILRRRMCLTMQHTHRSLYQIHLMVANKEKWNNQSLNGHLNVNEISRWIRSFEISNTILRKMRNSNISCIILFRRLILKWRLRASSLHIERGPRGLVGTGANQDGKYEPNRVLIGTSSSNTKWDRIKSIKIACRLHDLLLEWNIPCYRTLQGGAGGLSGDEVVG